MNYYYYLVFNNVLVDVSTKMLFIHRSWDIFFSIQRSKVTFP